MELTLLVSVCCCIAVNYFAAVCFLQCSSCMGWSAQGRAPLGGIPNPVPIGPRSELFFM